MSFDDSAIQEFQRRFGVFKTKLPVVLGTEANNFFRGNYRLQGWRGDNGLEKWKPRKPGASREKGRAILVDTGRLLRSIKSYPKASRVVISSNRPYAAIHNSGGAINAVQQVRAHKRRRRSARGRRGKTHVVAAHQRKVSIKMPRRQFMGNSAALERILRRQTSILFKRYVL